MDYESSKRRVEHFAIETSMTSIRRIEDPGHRREVALELIRTLSDEVQALELVAATAGRAMVDAYIEGQQLPVSESSPS